MDADLKPSCPDGPDRTEPLGTIAAGINGRVASRISRAGLATTAAAFYLIPLYRAGLRGDLRVHLRFAEQFALSGVSSDPYQLFSQLVIIARALIPFGLIGAVFPTAITRSTTWTVSGLLICSLAVAATAEIVRSRLASAQPIAFRHAPSKTLARATLYRPILLSLIVLLLGPVTVLTWGEHQMIGGYIAANIFDNGTYLLMRPIAVLLFWKVSDLFQLDSDTRSLALLAGLAALLPMAKPTLSICLIPGLVIFSFVRYVQRRHVPMRHIVLGFIVPTLVALSLQLLMVMDKSGEIVVAPLVVLRRLADHSGMSVGWFLPLGILSCLYPLSVIVVSRRRALQSVPLQLAWITLAIATAYVSLLEIRGRPDYGEFLGTTQICLFILLVESTRWCIAEGIFARGQLRSPRSIAISSALGLQLMCGLAFWFLESTQPLLWH